MIRLKAATNIDLNQDIFMTGQCDDYAQKRKVHLIVQFATKATDTEWQLRALRGVLLFHHKNTPGDLSSFHIQDAK